MHKILSKSNGLSVEEQEVWCNFLLGAGGGDVCEPVVFYLSANVFKINLLIL